LSSHILSEVEALCDRVGILREGRLVEMGTLEEMRHLPQQQLAAAMKQYWTGLAKTGSPNSLAEPP
jgi:ABC-2 type transport system ATP-binding protein